MNKQNNLLQTTPKSRYKAFDVIAMLYVTIMLITIAVAYKLVSIHGINMVSSSLILPIWLVIGDVIAEVYGYKAARKIIWMGLVCEFLFIFTVYFLINLPSPSYWHYESSYQYVYGELPRVFVGSLLGVIIGSFLNAYVITKWKILVKGRFFWIRSIFSSAAGEGVFTIIVIISNYLGDFSLSNLLELMLVSYLLKLIMSALSVFPATLLSHYLKRLEGIDVYDYDTNFNPFKLSE